MSGSISLLIVDDDAMVARALSRGLKANGWSPVVAASPEEATKRYKDVSLVLSDWNMPGSDGGAQVLRDSPVPVVIMSADPSNRGRAMAQGAAAFLDKPPFWDTVDEVLRNALHDAFHDHPSNPEHCPVNERCPGDIK